MKKKMMRVLEKAHGLQDDESFGEGLPWRLLHLFLAFLQTTGAQQWWKMNHARIVPSKESGSNSNMYYSFDAGGVHYIMLGADDTMNLGGIKTSSLEIERVCDRADESIVETVAVSVAPIGGGPEMLVIFVALKPGYTGDP